MATDPLAIKDVTGMDYRAPWFELEPIRRQGLSQRWTRLWSSLEASVTTVVVADPISIQYLAGHAVDPTTFHHQGAAHVLVGGRYEPPILIVDTSAAGGLFPWPAISTRTHPWYDGVHAPRLSRNDALLEAITQHLPVPSLEDECQVGVDRAAAGLLNAPEPVLPRCKLRLLDERALHRQRLVKDDDEVALIRLAANIAFEAVYATFRACRPQWTEWDMYSRVVSEVASRLGRAVPVYGDFKITTAGDVGGGRPTCTQMSVGDWILVDCSVVLSGYRCDMAETMQLGTPDATYQRFRLACVEAQRAGERCLFPGRSAAEAFHAVHGTLIEHGFNAGLVHHAGHGIGLTHPEPPFLTADSMDIFQVGQVVTLEPGVYVSGQGAMRLEQNYVITADGPVRLHNAEISTTPPNV